MINAHIDRTTGEKKIHTESLAKEMRKFIDELLSPVAGNDSDGELPALDSN